MRRPDVSHARAALAAAFLAGLLGCASAWAQGPATPPVPIAAATLAIAAADEATPSAQEPNSGSARYAVFLILLLLIVSGVLTSIRLARRGHSLPVRDIAGLLMFEEAVARATEMGRPTLFTCGGMCEMRRVQLFASMPLLRQVAKLSGTFGNRLIVPVAFPETLPVHGNAVRDGYMEADAIEEFRSDDVRFFPGGQFFFAMAAMGWMLKEKPATCFYFGHWEADSLMLAETGQTVGAMQIAGTDQLYQIPFFVAACDYTVIGEEFWAASAKISRDPQLLGSIGAQDIFKVIILIMIVAGLLLCFWGEFDEWMNAVVRAYV